MKRLTTLAAALAALSACGGDENAGGLSAEENRELNNAAEMLDASPDSLVAGEDAGLGNGEEPAQTGALPVVDEGGNNVAAVNSQ
jgi:hypothetical protein